MARSRSSKSTGFTTIENSETSQEPVIDTASPVEEPKEDAKAPVSLETFIDETPEPLKEASAEKIQTDVREKLAKKTDKADAFVPSNPASLEKAAAEVAKESGFELNRGTSVGARLLARAQKRV